MGSGSDYDVFLSYAHSDGAAAAELNGWLCDQGLSTFFDRRELRPGLRWIPALEDAIGRSKAVAILVGKHGIGNTQQYERELALVRQTGDTALPVIPVLMPGCDSPPTGFLQLLTWVDLSKGTNVLQQTDSLAALRAALRGEAIASSSIRASICPYRGLEPFREEDAAFFCGRDDAIRELVARVQEHSFVAVVGPSGSGKSSLVFAGLLPALRRQSRTTMWDMITFRPGKSPLRALAEAFGTGPENAGPAEIDARLEKEAAFYRAGDADMLGRMVDRRLDAAPEKPDRLLIYLDQWEELYAMAPAAEDKERFQQHSGDVEKFIALLVAATSGSKARASVVLTVRADFYNPLISSSSISARLPLQQVNIPPMRPDDLRSAIETPAKKAGLSFAPPELVDQIMNDVGSEEGRLPLLQFALKETWEKRAGDKLTAEAYTAVGGVARAIEKTAQDAYDRLTPAQQDAARRLLLRLVTPGEGQDDTRARSLIPDDPQQRDIINRFSNPKTRLLVTDAATLQGQAGSDARATVEVAHEALIQRWPTLRAWVRDNRDKLRARAAMLRAKREWEENSQNESFLLDPGVQLERGRALLGNPGDVAVDDIRDYIRRSIDKDQRRLDAEREAAIADQKRIADAERQARESAEEAASQAKARAAAEEQMRAAAEQKTEIEQHARKDAEALAAVKQRTTYFVGAALLIVLGLAALSYIQWRRADLSLALATDAANTMVADLAKSMRDRAGMPIDLVRDILAKAQKLQQQLIDSGGERRRVQVSQAEALNEVVLTEFALGDDNSALSAASDFLSKTDALIAAEPNNPEIQRLRSFAYDRMGDAEMRVGRYGDALENFSHSVALRKTLAEGGAAQARADFAAAYEKLGEAQHALGGDDRDREATRSFDQSLDIRKALVEENPTNAERRRDLGLSYERRGWLSESFGNQEEALDLFNANLELREQLQRKSPSDTQARQDLANARDFVGLALQRLERNDEALAEFIKSRDLRKSLAEDDPKKLEWQRDLAVGYAHCGDAYLKLNHTESALAQFHSALSIREGLTRTAPANALWQSDLALDFRRLAEAGEDARGNLEKALAIVRNLEAERKLPAQFAGLAEDLERSLAATAP